MNEYDKETICRYLEDVKNSYKDVEKILSFPFDTLNIDELREIFDAYKDTVNEFEYLEDELINKLNCKKELL